MLDIFLNDPFNIDKLSKKTSFFASVYFYVSFSLIAITPVLFFLESANEKNIPKKTYESTKTETKPVRPGITNKITTVNTMVISLSTSS